MSILHSGICLLNLYSLQLWLVAHTDPDLSSRTKNCWVCISFPLFEVSFPLDFPVSWRSLPLNNLEHHPKYQCDEPANWGIIWMPVFLPIGRWRFWWQDLLAFSFYYLLVNNNVNNKNKAGNYFSIVWGSDLSKSNRTRAHFLVKLSSDFMLKKHSG